jgi:hypothetical protein
MGLFSKRNFSFILPIARLMVTMIWPLTGLASENWQLVMCIIAIAFAVIYMLGRKD